MNARSVSIPAISIVLLCGCTSWTPSGAHRSQPSAIHDTVERPAAVAAKANKVVFHAMSLIGTPYRWGGESRQDGFDCSGLVQYVYRNAVGITLPRTSAAMSAMAVPKITRFSALATGDLLFFRTGFSGITHVGIYVGNGQFIDAPGSGDKVRLEWLTRSYWRQHFAFARRVLGVPKRHADASLGYAD